MHASKNNNNKRLETRKKVTKPYEWNDINIYDFIQKSRALAPYSAHFGANKAQNCPYLVINA